MFVSLRMITLPPARIDDAEALAAALAEVARELPNVASCWSAPVLSVAAINAGHVVWRMEFGSERDALAVTLAPVWQRSIAPLLAGAQVSGVGYRVTRRGVRPGGAGIWRALVFRVMPQGYPDGVKELEAALLLMPNYVGTIRSWALSPVSLVEGPKAFTHVWEQEFDDVEGLTGEYMTHSVHWGVADAYFDAEYPDYIVDPQLTQVVGAIGASIMT